MPPDWQATHSCHVHSIWAPLHQHSVFAREVKGKRGIEEERNTLYLSDLHSRNLPHDIAISLIPMGKSSQSTFKRLSKCTTSCMKFCWVPCHPSAVWPTWIWRHLPGRGENETVVYFTVIIFLMISSISTLLRLCRCMSPFSPSTSYLQLTRRRNQDTSTHDSECWRYAPCSCDGY
jgi:hypothetical protein